MSGRCSSRRVVRFLSSSAAHHHPPTIILSPRSRRGRYARITVTRVSARRPRGQMANRFFSTSSCAAAAAPLLADQKTGIEREKKPVTPVVVRRARSSGRLRFFFSVSTTVRSSVTIIIINARRTGQNNNNENKNRRRTNSLLRLPRPRRPEPAELAGPPPSRDLTVGREYYLGVCRFALCRLNRNIFVYVRDENAACSIIFRTYTGRVERSRIFPYRPTVSFVFCLPFFFSYTSKKPSDSRIRHRGDGAAYCIVIIYHHVVVGGGDAVDNGGGRIFK